MASSLKDSEHSLENEKYAWLGDADSDYIAVDYEKAKCFPADYMHAAHGMIFSRSDKIIFNTFHTRGTVLMQMRFDGVLGFPGGLIEPGEDPVFGLNREMEEEIGLEVSKHSFTASEHIETVVHERKKLVLHFFVKEVSEEEFLVIEKNNIAAEEYGIEVMGAVRVPLFTMADGLRGFPAFLSNQFVGNARMQLLAGLAHCKLMTRDELMKAVQTSRLHLAQSCGEL